MSGPRSTLAPTGRRSIGGASAAALGLLILLVLPGASATGAPATASRGPLLLHAGTLGPNESVSGTVVDDYSGAPLANVTVNALDFTLVWQHTTTGAHGRFTVQSVPGSVYLTVDPPNGYSGASLRVPVGNASVTGVVIALVPSARIDALGGPGTLDAPVLLGLGAGLVAFAYAGATAYRRRRIEAGETVPGLSRFGRYVVYRAALIPFQLVGILIILYIFGTFLPALARANRTDCLNLNGGACAPCPPSQFSCQVSTFGSGLVSFLSSILTGQWGLATFGALRLPAIDFIQWWLPDSLELAAVALAISFLIGYPLGLAAGWRADGLLDRSLRSLSLVLLLIPTFLVVLFLVEGIYTPWTGFFGDSPYGLLPTATWYLSHGGVPTWIGVGGNSSPTGFPIVDGALHGNWPFVAVVASKLLIQAIAIAIIYVSIFFRYARHAVAEAARSEAIRAARSRGVPEATLTWRHAGRRVLPILVLIFGMTLPAYVGTQAIVEVLFNDSEGFGTILFAEMTQVASGGFGLRHLGVVPIGNLYQVTILFLAGLLLVGNLCADILARHLDHSLDASEER